MFAKYLPSVSFTLLLTYLCEIWCGKPLSSLNLISPEVRIKDGRVRGEIERTVDRHRPFFSFRGIPYAVPPVGDLRFKSPVKNEKWDYILDATKDKPSCLQHSSDESEDCLYINVYTPSLTSKNIPVMLWITGGGFSAGSSDYKSNGPDYLLEENVVFVSFNYRLNVFGFLSMGDSECPGNFGLKDQLLALRWVKENIGFFGGDPDQITVFGQSAGAASTAYLLQTDKTKGLFNSVIMESGSSLCLWALSQRNKQMSASLADFFNIETRNTTEILAVLRNKSAEELQTASIEIGELYMMANSFEGFLWSPAIEPTHQDAIITELSHEKLKNGNIPDIPILIGFNSNEASSKQGVPAILRPYLIYYDVVYENLAPINLTQNRETRSQAAQIIKRYYFGNRALAVQTEPVIQFISDDQFNRPIRETARLLSMKNRVYFYRFAYEGALGGVTNREIEGVGHAEELGYIFRSYYNSTNTFDDITRKRMVKMWTNFAKYHNPTPTKDELLEYVEWPVVENELTYLNIDKKLEVLKNPNSENMKFYDKIYTLYGTPPFSTY